MHQKVHRVSDACHSDLLVAPKQEDSEPHPYFIYFPDVFGLFQSGDIFAADWLGYWMKVGIRSQLSMTRDPP